MSSQRAARRLVACSAVVLASTLASASARAQIVNVVSVLSTDPEPGLSGSFTGFIDWRTGNVDLLRLSSALTVRLHSGHHDAIAIGKADFGKTSGERFLARTFEHLRYRFEITDRLLLESFGQHEYDEFRRLELRALFGMGVAMSLVRRDRVHVSAGIAYMPEYERLQKDDQPDAGESEIFHRVSGYALARVDLDQRVQLAQIVYAQPRIDDPRDARFLSETQFTVQVTEHVAQTTSFTFAYDTRSPDAVDEQDTTFKTGVTLSF